MRYESTTVVNALTAFNKCFTVGVNMCTVGLHRILSRHLTFPKFILKPGVVVLVYSATASPRFFWLLLFIVVVFFLLYCFLTSDLNPGVFGDTCNQWC